MTTENIYVSITPLPLSTDPDFIESVNTFALRPDMADLTLLQRDGATAVIDLSMQFADRGYQCDIELLSQVLGRLIDIQVRDFALGTHNEKTFDIYWEYVALSLAGCTRWICRTSCLSLCHIGVRARG